MGRDVPVAENPAISLAKAGFGQRLTTLRPATSYFPIQFIGLFHSF